MSRTNDPCRILGGLSPPHQEQVGCPVLSQSTYSTRLSSLADAQDAGKAPCLMLAWPGGAASFWPAPCGSRSCREAGSKCGGHPNGTLLSILRAAVSASQALMLLPWKGARPEDGQVSPRLGLLLALLCARAQLLCLPVVQREEGRDDVGARTRPPGVLRALDARPCPAGVRSQWVLRTAGRQPSRVLLSS